jgi:DNA polymerase III delta prime subunit
MNEQLIVQIICDREVGTAFYVAPDLLLTAWHTVASYKESGNNIVKDVEGNLTFAVDKNYEEADIAVLKVKGRASSECLPLYSHTIKVKEEVSSFGFPDSAKNEGLVIDGIVKQKVANATRDFCVQVKNVNDAFDYNGMSGAPVLLEGKVVGIVIEQSGYNLTIVSIHKVKELLKAEGIITEEDIKLTDIPESIAQSVTLSIPNYSVMGTLDEKIEEGESNWLLLYGSPGCGKTTLSASYEPDNKDVEVLGRFFFKVPNDPLSRAVRCSESHFAEFLESVYINKTGDEIEKLSFDDRKKRIPRWFNIISRKLLEDDKRGVLIIDGLDELAEDNQNRVGDFLMMLPETMPQNISVVLSCISREILPTSIIEKIVTSNYIEVTPLDMAACESFIQANSGEWDKPYSFVQAVANKTEGHPLYMNYLCRYIANTFDEKTRESKLIEWLDSLPTISGNIRSYYEAIWKKVDPNGVVVEVLALLSQTRGAIDEAQLIGMMKNPNPFEFKSVTKEFRHLLKEKDEDVYEIYHSSFRLFVTGKLLSVVSYANDQIAAYCEDHPETNYTIENYLHHVVNGSDVKKGLTLCNQKWADNCAKHDVSPDLVMHDIKECLSFAVDQGLAVEVIRLMLLAQRIENRNDSIMVDNVDDIAELAFILGKPDVVMKYVVRDHILLVSLQTAIHYLRVLFEKGYREQAFVLSGAIEASIRKELSDTSKKGASSSVLAAKGYLIVEGTMAGIQEPTALLHYFKYLYKIVDKNDEDSLKAFNSVQDVVVAYQLSNELRLGKKIPFEKYLQTSKKGWDERFLMLLVKTLKLYDEKDSVLNRIGRNDAYFDCLKLVETVLESYSFTFSELDLQILLAVLVHQSCQVSVVQKLLKEYNPKPGALVFRDDNGVDIDPESLAIYYQENLYMAYMNEKQLCPKVNRGYYGDIVWERYVEALVTRVAYIDGTLCRKKATGEDYIDMYDQVNEVLQCIDFPFEVRTLWQRSYLLPEELFPFIYDKLAEIYCHFFEDRLNDFVEHLKSRMPNQLCLYREGYCAALIRLTSIFSTKTQTKNVALFLADETVKYVKYAIQNRGERCSYLLKISQEYARLNENEKAIEVYQEMLNSSMGPDWYKEAQMELINEYRKTDIILTREQVGHLAAIFEEASGEMTFQRYVQQEKNEFVATIAKASSLTDAIAYYKFETLPMAERIISNAEDWDVDMPRKGDGYDLGCNHLIEASAICHLLRECKDVSPYIRYAVSELFWNNWDKMHNDHQYAKLHAEIAATLGEDKLESELIQRMSSYYVHDYYLDKKGTYLKDLEETNISSAILDTLEKTLKEQGYTWKRMPNKKEEYEREKSFANLTTCKSVLETKRKNIISPISSYWYALSEFITPLINQPDFEKEQLFKVIAGHYDINVKPSQHQFDKFTWFVGPFEERNKDEQMIHFLIWFLVHPDRNVASRAEGVLLWLSGFDDRTVTCLMKEMLCPNEIGLDVAASAILLEVAKVYPTAICRYLQRDGILEKIISIPNFSISRNLYETALIIAKECRETRLLDKMKSIIPESLPDRGEVMLDDEDMILFSNKIDKLNNLQVTGGKEFAMPYVEAVRAMRKDGTLSRLKQSDQYVRRSFHLDYSPHGRYDRTMEAVFNKVLYGKVDYRRAGRVYYVIN